MWASHSLKPMIMQTGASILRNVECGKLSRGNLRKINCETFCKLPLIAFPHSAAEKFRISVDCRTTVRLHCTTDVKPKHSSIRRLAVTSFRILCGPFAKEQGSFLQFQLTSKSLPRSECHIISLVGVIGFNLYNRCDSHTDDSCNHSEQ